MSFFDVTIAVLFIWLVIDALVVAILFAAARRRDEPLPQPARAPRERSLRFARSRAEAERSRA